MKLLKTRLFIAYFAGMLVLALANSPTASGQETAEESPELPAEESIEEITVYGEKSIIQLRKEFEVAQVQLFDVFNELNSTDEFDIECEYVRRTNSRRTDQLCTPKFAMRPAAHGGAGILVWDERKGTATMVPHRTHRLNKRLWEEMAELAREDQELQKAFGDVEAAKNALEAERERRRKD